VRPGHRDALRDPELARFRIADLAAGPSPDIDETVMTRELRYRPTASAITP